MAFLPTIPLATDQLAISQGNILNNFTLLGAIAGNANNSSASINAASGFNWLYLPPQGANPPAGSAFAKGNIALYSSVSALTGLNELYVNKQDAGPTAYQIPMTASIFGTNSNPGPESNGWSYLPSGLIIQWGTTDNAFFGANQTQTITFPIEFTTACIQVMVTAYIGTMTVSTVLYTSSAPTTTEVVLKATAPTGSLYGMWFAIGY